jgi:hypothetical protein
MGSKPDILQWATRELCPVYDAIKAATGRYPARIPPGDAIWFGLRATFPVGCGVRIERHTVDEAGVRDAAWKPVPLNCGWCFAIYERDDTKPFLAILPMPMRNKTLMWTFAETGDDWQSGMIEAEAAGFAAAAIVKRMGAIDATPEPIRRITTTYIH